MEWKIEWARGRPNLNQVTPILMNGFDQKLIWGSIYDAYMEVNQVPES